MRFAYHATRRELVDVIRAEGLRPTPQADRTEQRCIDPDEPALFFCPTEDLARTWNEVVIRFPWPGDAEKDDYGDSFLIDGEWSYTNWFSQMAVPATDIEVPTNVHKEDTAR